MAGRALKRDQQRVCEVCGDTFQRGDRGDTSWERARYCSHACRAVGIRVEKPPRVCEQCGDVFECRYVTSLADWNARRFCGRRCALASVGGKGPDAPRWNGGSSGWHGTQDHKDWALAVKERDDYRCQSCGRTDKIQAHHIKRVRLYPELRYAIANGTTLCASCHRRADGATRGRTVATA